MTKRLDILTASLEKKNSVFEDRLSAHFDDVKSANGQPLNDKGAKGRATLSRWEKQNDALRNCQEEIEKTERAIEREKDKIAYCELTMAELPQCIVDLVNDGTLRQWRKFPNTFFVNGVEKGRLVFDLKKQFLFQRYASEIPTQEQYAKFREIFIQLQQTLNESQTKS